MAVSVVMGTIYPIIESMWVEVSFMLCFLLGFALFRLDLIVQGKKATKQKKVVEEPVAPREFDPRLKAAAEAEKGAEAVLAAWKAGRDRAPTPPDMLKAVVHALLELEPDTLVKQLLQHVRVHGAHLSNARAAVAALDVIARAGCVRLMADLHEAFRRDLGVRPTTQVYEVLLGGYATAGEEQKVKQVLGEMAACRLTISARGLCLLIKGFLKNSMVDQVLEQVRVMIGLGLQVPPFAVTQLFRIACEKGRAAEVFDEVLALAPVPADAVSSVLEDCSKRGDLELARRVEKVAREAGVELNPVSYDALLKLHTLAGDPHAIVLFERMQQSNLRISEGLCVALLARCAESRFLRFAEDIVKFERAREGMTIATYSALMKVYAYCSMYQKACDLYDRILADGLQPDAMMYSCLMKFAAECGRTDLSRKFSALMPSLDIQNYMSLIRAATRDKDSDRALSTLRELEASQAKVDASVYNSVLDACASAGHIEKAAALVEEMRGKTGVDIITYNTLLKGFCVTNDIAGARALVDKMISEEIQPNDITFNCLLNIAASAGNFREAWTIVDMMETSGVKVDNYTISIMLKALRRGGGAAEDVDRALALLDRSGLSVCADEIMMNVVLDTCIRRKDHRRLEGCLRDYEASDLKASAHTYAFLIKACGTLGRIDRCWFYWNQMLGLRGTDPTEICLGCMLDALACNQAAEDAVELLNKWRGHVKVNSIMYSTIIKGFANARQPERALALWREMRQEGVATNTVVYNAVIDAQARVGAMDNVAELVEAMQKDGVQPDSISLSTIAKGYCIKGDLEKAFEVLRDMQKNNMAKDSIVYNTVLDGCTRHSRFDLADELLVDMEGMGIKPSNYTLGITVKMWGRRRQLARAFQALEEAPRRWGLTANSQVFNCLMGACLTNGEVDRAMEVFRHVTATFGVDAKALGSMVAGCTRHGELQKAVELVEEAYGLATGPGLHRLPRGQTVAAEHLERLTRALVQRGLGEEVAVPLLDKLRVAGVPVSVRLYSKVMEDAAGGAWQKTTPATRRPAPGGRRNW